ncbi:hypothetical protein [Streptomyces sp. SPB074]|uniref:hypothetical protein n=1 Tax=Streptomyces sp. (strain SPB074) TaxID=465543 RepID=UPI00017F279E|nr:hypothetical protein [Streptomyces sp. SPB074]EDY44604.1 hypothetical protein SSBG_02566 [Streptomyces sp. SPB074]
MRTNACERCGRVIRRGEEIEEIPRDAISGARPSATVHAACPRDRRRHARLRRELAAARAAH